MPGQIKILKALKFTNESKDLLPDFDILELCSYDNCKKLAMVSCPNNDYNPICFFHCKETCEMGKGDKCELLNFKESVSRFYTNIEKIISNKKDFNFETDVLKIVEDFISKSFLTLNLWYFQLQPEHHHKSLVCRDFENMFLKFSTLDLFINLLKEDIKDLSFLFEYLILLEVLNYFTYSLRKYFLKKSIDLDNINKLELRSEISEIFPTLICVKECSKFINWLLLFLNHFYPVTKISSIINDKDFSRKTSWIKEICGEKVEKNECNQNCKQFFGTKKSFENVREKSLMLFFDIINNLRFKLLNIGVIHIYNEDTGYGAAYCSLESLNYEKEYKSQRFQKIQNPILLIDKNFFRNHLISHRGAKMIAKSTQEPFLIVNRFKKSNSWDQIILRHYYSGIYIPINIKKFFYNPSLINDIFYGIGIIQEDKKISQATAAAQIIEKLFENSDIIDQFSKMDLNPISLRDLGGGKGELSTLLLKKILELRKDVKIRELLIIDMDFGIRKEAQKNFLKILNYKKLTPSLLSLLKVQEQTNFFKEIFKCDEIFNLSLISQVLDMYILVDYRSELNQYSFSIREFYILFSQNIFYEIKRFFDKDYVIKGNENIVFSSIRENIRTSYKLSLNNMKFIPDFLLSPYYAGIWLKSKYKDLDYNPLMKNIAYDRTNKFYEEIYVILEKIFEISNYVLIIDRGVTKSFLEKYFEKYEIFSLEGKSGIKIKFPNITLNLIIIKQKK